MRKSCHSLKIFRSLLVFAVVGCAKMGNWPAASREARVSWIVDESWSDRTGRDLGTSQHRLLTAVGLVRFGGVDADRHVVPFLATEWDSSDDSEWKFSVPPFWDSSGRPVLIAELVESLRDRLESRATPCGPGGKETDGIGRLVQRTLPGACESRRFRLLPSAITASAGAVSVRTSVPAPWLPWLLAQASLWVGEPERAGEPSWGEFRWVESRAERRIYGRNVNFAAFRAAAGARGKIPAGPVRELPLDVRAVTAPELRAAYVEEGNADIVDGVDARWNRPKTARLVEKEDGVWLLAHDVSKAALDCELLARQTGQRWVSVDESERKTAQFLLGEGVDESRRATLPPEVREALGAQAYVAALDEREREGSGTPATASLAGVSLFGFGGTAVSFLPGRRRGETEARCSRRRFAVRSARLDEWHLGVWEPGAGWNLAADTSGVPSAVLYGQDSWWPVDKR